MAKLLSVYRRGERVIFLHLYAPCIIMHLRLTQKRIAHTVFLTLFVEYIQ